ncbi:mating-type alpha-pheromone receptor PreB [Talaromyces proteolyticus]|uniref:Mating-type alpha-pheromone receptor PreB n=1 Tax=Talaromyces proteolyticus TaxID=1131652 RepID=A0AAD4KLS8_9EURO|nr:mating-type alpha-pheromone receptor PreB [Talaromyces proteolyticus]KAH8694950.1 mating-type alpha-pheromone receptor PreB [Talaromyces proteolyticus]
MAGFNPFEQNITFITSDGTPFNITMVDLDGYIQFGITSCIDYGSELGATVVIFVLMLLLTKSKKRRSAVFGLNMAALFLNTARLICEILYFTGAFFETYAYFSGDFSRVKPSNYANTVLGTVLLALLQVCTECSLVLQAMVVCVNLPKLSKILLQSILNAKYTLEQRDFSDYVWLEKANTILLTISICFFSAVFMCKLAYSIWRRRQLGIRQFGPMQVLFIMSCQTMLVPAIFAILQFTTDIPGINSNVSTFVVISLPVTSLWAGSALPGQPKSRANSESGRPLWNVISSSTPARSGENSFGSSRGFTLPLTTGARADVDLIYRDLEDGKTTFGPPRDSGIH